MFAADRRGWRSLNSPGGDDIIKVVGFTLFHHWKDTLDSCPNILVKVFRFLVLFYGEQSTRIAFPPESHPAPSIQIDVDARPNLPRSPEQIRLLLIKISEAISDSAAKASG